MRALRRRPPPWLRRRAVAPQVGGRGGRRLSCLCPSARRPVPSSARSPIGSPNPLGFPLAPRSAPSHARRHRGGASRRRPPTRLESAAASRRRPPSRGAGVASLASARGAHPPPPLPLAPPSAPQTRWGFRSLPDRPPLSPSDTEGFGGGARASCPQKRKARVSRGGGCLGRFISCPPCDTQAADEAVATATRATHFILAPPKTKRHCARAWGSPVNYQQALHHLPAWRHDRENSNGGGMVEFNGEATCGLTHGGEQNSTISENNKPFAKLREMESPD